MEQNYLAKYYTILCTFTIYQTRTSFRESYVHKLQATVVTVDVYSINKFINSYKS